MRRNTIKRELVKKEHFPKRGYMAEAVIMRHESQKNDPFMVLYGKDEYTIRISRYVVREDGKIDFDLCGVCSMTSTDASLMNTIWYNICNREISYEELEKFFDYDGME